MERYEFKEETKHHKSSGYISKDGHTMFLQDAVRDIEHLQRIGKDLTTKVEELTAENSNYLAENETVPHEVVAISVDKGVSLMEAWKIRYAHSQRVIDLLEVYWNKDKTICANCDIDCPAIDGKHCTAENFGSAMVEWAEAAAKK